MSTLLTGAEVAEQLRRAIRGEVSVRLAVSEVSWEGWGNVEFAFGDWRITFFNDAGELDYCDSAIAPDGRTGEFENWTSKLDDDGNQIREYSEPTDLLSRKESRELERLLELAR